MCEAPAQQRFEPPASTKATPLAGGSFISRDLVNNQVIAADTKVLFSIGNGRSQQLAHVTAPPPWA